MKRLGQQDLLRQMLGIEWTEPVQLLNHFRGDSMPAMHHAMPHCGQCIMPGAFLNPNPSERPLLPCDSALSLTA